MEKKKTAKTFKSYLQIDKGNLNDSMTTLATTIYDFGLRQSKLTDELMKLELQLEIKEAKLSGLKRAALTNVNKKYTPTETTIKDQVKYHPEIIELKEAIIEKKRLVGLAKLKNKTLYVKKDMIENISHNIREEKKSSKKIK